MEAWQTTEEEQEDEKVFYMSMTSAIVSLVATVMLFPPVLIYAKRLNTSSQKILEKSRNPRRGRSRYAVRSKATTTWLDKLIYWLLSTPVQMRARQAFAAETVLIYVLVVAILIVAIIITKRELPERHPIRQLIEIIFLATPGVYIMQCVLLLWCYTSRLISTFSESAMVRVHPHTAHAVLAFLVFNLITSALAFLLYLTIQSALVFVICLSIVLIVYLGLCIFLVVSFLRNMMKVATAGISESDGASAPVVDRGLADTALRVTVCAVLSLVSNCLLSVVFSLFLVKQCPGCPLFFETSPAVAFSLDSLINVFCLECSFRDGNADYLVVFGWLHDRLLGKWVHHLHLSQSIVSDDNNLN